MSTELGKIKGRYENSKKLNEVEYEKNAVYLTSFYDGEKNGLMLQITIDNPKIIYSQLTHKQVIKLRNKLNKWLDELR